ncbi:MAG TPA: acyl-CoA dehydrogenase family protein [Rubrivivax sp.]|nr:acyl-CoA dehydrogenase family protein [Rubrivivax sp.]
MTLTTDEIRETRTALADTVERFARAEIAPHASAWDEAGEFPRQLYRRAAELGLLGLGYPEALGGSGTDAQYTLRMVMTRGLCRWGTSGGVHASLLSHNIGTPPIVLLARDDLTREVVPPILAGEAISALGITEPGGGSDVAAIRTTARRVADEYVVNGEKTFITSGMRADWITLAVRTDPDARGAKGLSLLLVPGDTKGLQRVALKKMGWWASDTAHLSFDHMRVPARCLLGEENKGFLAVMHNFNGERFGIAAATLGFAEACYDEALAWAQQRKTFGRSLVEHQVVRHKLVDMQQRIRATAAWLEELAARADAGDTGADWVGAVSMLKNQATQTMHFCADEGVQILGGMGYMRGTVCERIYREVKVLTIGGGTDEIMKELAARQWGIV